MKIDVVPPPVQENTYTFSGLSRREALAIVYFFSFKIGGNLSYQEYSRALGTNLEQLRDVFEDLKIEGTWL